MKEGSKGRNEVSVEEGRKEEGGGGWGGEKKRKIINLVQV